MLDAIGETGRVVGVSGIDYISNPDIQARRDSVGDVGYEGVKVLFFEDKALIKKGLYPNDIIVTAGVADLKDGQKVMIHKAAAIMCAKVSLPQPSSPSKRMVCGKRPSVKKLTSVFLALSFE